VSVLNNDIPIISQNYFMNIVMFSRDIITILMAVAALTTISPVNAVIIAVTSFLPVVAPIIYSNKLSSTQMKASIANISFNQKVKDYLTGFEVIKTFRVERKIISKFYESAKNQMMANYKVQAAGADLTAMLMSISRIISFSGYFVAGFFVMRGSITVGDLVAIVAISGFISNPVIMLSSQIGSIKATKEISRRVLEMMDDDNETARNVEIDIFNKAIEFRGVNFSYEMKENGNVVKPPEVLKNVNFTIKNNEKYAIVGESGSGKTTIAKLIMGYYDNYEGRILVDGKEMRDINREDLYRLFSTLHQNVFMLDDTLKNNMTLYNQYDDDLFADVLKKANLDSVVGNLPDGIETLLREGGNIISGGERQRVAIARALLKGSSVMVLDEATASLDNITAYELENTIINMYGLTCLFITHRYTQEILSKCDGILVMKNGVLIEQGTFSELLERKGYFYSLYSTSGE